MWAFIACLLTGGKNDTHKYSYRAHSQDSNWNNDVGIASCG